MQSRAFEHEEHIQHGFVPHIARWPVNMHEEFPKLYHYQRGNEQFVTLIRLHAQYISDEEFLFQLFAKHCLAHPTKHGR